MDFLLRIRQKIDDFCINSMRIDGAQHLIAGILIFDVLKYLMHSLVCHTNSLDYTCHKRSCFRQMDKERGS